MALRMQLSLPARRLNPFAFPSDTDFRFLLLIVTVLGSTAFIFNDFALVQHWSDLKSAALCQLRANVDIEQGGGVIANCIRQFAIIDNVYMLAGLVLVLAGAGVIYLLYPTWILWRGHLTPLMEEDDPDLMAHLDELTRRARLTPPVFVIDVSQTEPSGFAFGRSGRYYIALSSGLTALFSEDREHFRAVVLHELSHLRNADVGKTYFSLALCWSFLVVALLPFIVVSFINLLQGADIFLVLDQGWRVAIMAGLVFLIIAAFLRAREFYADVRASMLDDSSTSTLARIFSAASTSARSKLTAFSFHPSTSNRYHVLYDTAYLFRTGQWEALSVGIVIGMVFPNVHDGLYTLLYLFPALFVSNSSIDILVLCLALVLAPIAVTVVGLNVWRASFAQHVLGREKIASTGGLAGALLGVGIFLGLQLSLSASNLVDANINIFMLLLYRAPWGIIVVISLLLFMQWVEASASAWLEVAATRRTPRAIYLATIVFASIILIVCLSQVFRLWTLLDAIEASLAGNFSLFTALYLFLSIGIATFWLFMLRPEMLIAVICLWAFPLAAIFWQKRAVTMRPASWLFLPPEVQNVLTSLIRSFRPRRAVLSGLLGCVLFTLLLLIVRVAILLFIPQEVRAQDDFRVFLWGIYVGLAIASQLITFIVAIVWIERAGVLHGFFAVFIGGCIMTVVALIITVLFGGTLELFFIWITLCAIVNGGTLLILAIVPVIAALARVIHRPVGSLLSDVSRPDSNIR